MQDFPQVDEKQLLEEQIKHLEFIHYSIAEFQREKEKAEAKIIELLGHDIKGQKTYTVNMYSVEIKTGLITSLDTKKYDEYSRLPDWRFNPVSVKLKENFYLNKKLIDECRKYGTVEDNLLMDNIITEKDAKRSVKIYAAKNGVE